MRIYETKDKKNSLVRYIIETDQKYLVTLDSQTKGYPDKAKHPYKGRVLLIDNGKFIPILPYKGSKAREIYSKLIHKAGQSYQRGLHMAELYAQEEQEQLEKMLNSLHDI